MSEPIEIWIGGKGPSLDTFDWSKAGEHRVGINEAALIIPNCTIACAVDFAVRRRYTKELPKHIKLVHPRGDYKWEQVDLAGNIGTLNICIKTMYRYGARIYHFVGCDSVDGIQGYAESIKRIGGIGKNRDGFQKINNQLFKLLEELDVEYNFEHRS